MMQIKVLGAGCSRCESLEKLTKKAVEELQLDAIIEKEGDIEEILKYSVMCTPAWRSVKRLFSAVKSRD